MLANAERTNKVKCLSSYVIIASTQILTDFKIPSLAPGAYRRGWISVFIPPKSAQVNFMGQMTSERLFNSFIHPQKLLYPSKQISGYAPDWHTHSLSNKCR